MIIPSQVTDSFVPIAAGLIVSLFNKYVLSNPRFDACCQAATEEEADNESDVTNKTDESEALSRASVITTSTLPPPHPVHYHHHVH